MKKDKLNFLQNIRIIIWHIFDKDRYNMFYYSLQQGFPVKSSYHSAKYASKGVIKCINGKI